MREPRSLKGVACSMHLTLNLTFGRYYYAIAEFDSAASARRVYDEIDGTEMEATANIFDLRFVPEEMEFPGYECDLADPSKNDGWRDEASEAEMQGSSYKGVDFKTDVRCSVSAYIKGRSLTINGSIAGAETLESQADLGCRRSRTSQAHAPISTGIGKGRDPG